MRRFVFALLTAALFAGPAHAQQGGGLKLEGGQLGVHGIVTYYWAESGIGLGARYQIPVVPEGFLRHPRIKDDLAVDAGLDYVHISWGRGCVDINASGCVFDDIGFSAIIPTVGVLWNFWLTPQLAVYPKLDAGFAIGWWSVDWYGGYEPNMSSFFIQGVAGAVYKMGNLSLKGEVGSGMLKLGVLFQM